MILFEHVPNRSHLPVAELKPAVLRQQQIELGLHQARHRMSRISKQQMTQFVSHHVAEHHGDISVDCLQAARFADT